jgi:hypothetical protein
MQQSNIGNPHLDEPYRMDNLPLNEQEFIDYKIQLELQKRWLATPVEDLPEFMTPLPNKLVVVRPPVDKYKNDPSGKGIFVGDSVFRERLSDIPVYLRVEAVGENDRGVHRGDYVIFGGDMQGVASFMYRGVQFDVLELFQMAVLVKADQINHITLGYDKDKAKSNKFYSESEEAVIVAKKADEAKLQNNDTV